MTITKYESRKKRLTAIQNRLLETEPPRIVDLLNIDLAVFLERKKVYDNWYRHAKTFIILSKRFMALGREKKPGSVI